MTSIWDRRLKDLEDHIENDLALRKEYEDALRFEEDPRRKAKYKRDIDSLIESANNYQQELDELKNKIGKIIVNDHNTDTKLEQIETQLGMLMNTQVAICDYLSNLRQEISTQYETSEKNIVQVITNKLEDNQILTVKFILTALENNKISEIEIHQMISATQQALTTLQQSNISLPSEQKALAEVFSDPKIDAKHRLKVALPIIPFVLTYEGQIELGNGVNLKSLWQNLGAKFKVN